MRRLSVSVTSVQYMFVISMTLTISICYAIAVPLGMVDKRSFYISSTFFKDPTRAISSFGIPFIAFSAYGVFLARYLYADGFASVGSECRLRWIRRLATWSCISLIGLGAVTMRTLTILHGFFAFSLFTCSTTAILLMAFEDYSSLHQSMTHLIKMRFISGVISGLSVLAIVYGFLFDYVIASVAELVWVACMLWSLTSYTSEFRSYCLEISLTQISP